MLVIADLLQISIYISFAVLFVICALLLLVVLMQRPKLEGLGAAIGAAMTDQAFGARTTDVLKKATVLFGTLFFIVCLVLGILQSKEYKEEQSSLSTRAAATKKAEPAKPATENIGALLNKQPETPAADAAKPAETTAPAAPAAQPETPAPAQPAAEGDKEPASRPDSRIPVQP